MQGSKEGKKRDAKRSWLSEQNSFFLRFGKSYKRNGQRVRNGKQWSRERYLICGMQDKGSSLGSELVVSQLYCDGSSVSYAAETSCPTHGGPKQHTFIILHFCSLEVLTG